MRELGRQKPRISKKVCIECRHNNGEDFLWLQCQSPNVIFAMKKSDIKSGFYTNVARKYARYCGPEAKHFEPIGGADGQD